MIGKWTTVVGVAQRYCCFNLTEVLLLEQMGAQLLIDKFEILHGMCGMHFDTALLLIALVLRTVFENGTLAGQSVLAGAMGAV